MTAEYKSAKVAENFVQAINWKMITNPADFGPIIQKTIEDSGFKLVKRKTNGKG